MDKPHLKNIMEMIKENNLLFIIFCLHFLSIQCGRMGNWYRWIVV